MHVNRKLVAALTGAGLLAGGLAVAPAAQAAAAHASLHASQRYINVRHSEVFSFAEHHVPAGSHGYLQRLSGKKWVTVVALGTRRSGTVTAPKLNYTGTYRYRLAVYHHRWVTGTRSSYVGVLPAVSVSLKGIHTHVTANSTGATFSYAAHNLPSGWSLTLQRTYGSTYHSVMRLYHSSGTVTAPKIPMGRMYYRLVAYRGSSALAVGKGTPVYSYATINFTPMFSERGSYPQTTQVGNSLFNTTDIVDTSTAPKYTDNVIFDHDNPGSCRSLTMQFATDDFGQQRDIGINVQFVQTSRDPVYASTPAGTVGTVTVSLDGGPLVLNAASTGGAGAIARATASCYTSTGRR